MYLTKHGEVQKVDIIDLLEMISEQDEGAQGQDILEGLRVLVQSVFRDTETLTVDAKTVYDHLQPSKNNAKDTILQYLKKIERDGKFSRTKLDDLIHGLEEVMFALSGLSVRRS